MGCTQSNDAPGGQDVDLKLDSIFSNSNSSSIPNSNQWRVGDRVLSFWGVDRTYWPAHILESHHEAVSYLIEFENEITVQKHHVSISSLNSSSNSNSANAIRDASISISHSNSNSSSFNSIRQYEMASSAICPIWSAKDFGKWVWAWHDEDQAWYQATMMKTLKTSAMV